MSQASPVGPMTDAEPVPFIDLVAQHRTIEAEVMEAVGRVFANQAFILGSEVSELESEIATYCDAAEAIGCASGTDALSLALMALEIGPGDEVITTPFTFFATASTIASSRAGFAGFNTRPRDWSVAPVVSTSSTTTTRFPSTSLGFASANASRTFSARAALDVNDV